jgi:hypothetical protein
LPVPRDLNIEITHSLSLVEETKYLSSSLFALGFLVRHDSIGCGDEDASELTRGQQVDHPLFNLFVIDIKPRRDDSTLVETTIELDDNLVGTVIVYNFEFSNVSLLLHLPQELDDDLGDGSDENLSTPSLLRVGNGF